MYKPELQFENPSKNGQKTAHFPKFKVLRICRAQARDQILWLPTVVEVMGQLSDIVSTLR